MKRNLVLIFTIIFLSILLSACKSSGETHPREEVKLSDETTQQIIAVCHQVSVDECVDPDKRRLVEIICIDTATAYGELPSGMISLNPPQSNSDAFFNQLLARFRKDKYIMCSEYEQGQYKKRFFDLLD